jgi:hypothetical protein
LKPERWGSLLVQENNQEEKACDKRIISFMQGIYTYIPETNNVSKEYNVAAILSLLFMVPISLVPALTLM